MTQNVESAPKPHKPYDDWATCPACGRILFTYGRKSYCVYPDCAESPRHRQKQASIKVRRTPAQPPVTESPDGATG